MSRKISVGAALALALLLVAASIPLTMLYAQGRQNKLIKDLPKLIEEFGALQEIQKKVADKFYKDPAGDNVNIGMVRGYIAGLRDPGSRYLSAEEYKAYMERLEGNTPELGIVLKYSPEVVGLVIDQVKAGSTAAVSGLKPGDHIIKAESGGTPLSIREEIAPDKAAEEIDKFKEELAAIADTASIAVTITYKRDGAYQPPVNVMLGSAVSSISFDMMNGWAKEGEAPQKNVGCITIYHFFKNTADQLEAAIKEFGAQGAVSYILDVRGCSEGNLDSVLKAIDLFAYVSRDTDSMATVHYKDGSTAQYPSTANNIMSYTTGGFVAVLIDNNTSGVAELFAHDLRAYNPTKVFLVGAPTKGIGTVQETFELPTVGGAALLTVGVVTPYGVPDGQDWNKDGVQPNDPTDAEAKEGIVYRISGREQQLNGAIAVLTKPRG
jgi:carboxyl-terminal processing protease